MVDLYGKCRNKYTIHGSDGYHYLAKSEPKNCEMPLLKKLCSIETVSLFKDHSFIMNLNAFCVATSDLKPKTQRNNRIQHAYNLSVCLTFNLICNIVDYSCVFLKAWSHKIP